jgi:Protein of unknown function (DUF1569)
MLRCTTFSDVLATLEALPIQPRASQPQRLTPAQALVHCAQSIEYSMNGYPKLRSGLFRATIGPMVKRKFLRAGAMSHDRGAHIEGAPALPVDADLASALARLRRAIHTFRSYQGALGPHLAYGRCTRDEYEALHSMHVADHLEPWLV